MERYKRIEWSEQLLVGDTLIDEEHKGLLKIYNKLVDAFEKKEQKDKIVEVLTELTNYSLKHFKDEEEWMTRIDYPDFEEHQREHKDFIYRIAMFNLSFNREDEDMILQVSSFLRKWIVNHLVVTDKKIAEYKLLH